MGKRIKSKKITTLLAIMGILAMVFQLILGLLSILGLERVAGYYDEIIEMNNWKQEVVSADQEFIQMKSDILDFAYSSNTKKLSNAEERIEGMSSFFTDNLQRQDIDKEEKVIIEKLNSSYNVFSSFMKSKLDSVKEFKELMENNRPEPGQIPEEIKSYNSNFDSEQFNEITEAVEADFESLIECITNRTTAKKRICEVWVGNSRTFFGLVMLVAFVTSGIIMFTLIKVIKIAGKEVIEVLSKVADGNLNVDIDYYGNNEFEIIKRELKNTVDSFKAMISSVSDLSGNVNNKCE